MAEVKLEVEAGGLKFFTRKQPTGLHGKSNKLALVIEATNGNGRKILDELFSEDCLPTGGISRKNYVDQFGMPDPEKGSYILIPKWTNKKNLKEREEDGSEEASTEDGNE